MGPMSFLDKWRGDRDRKPPARERGPLALHEPLAEKELANVFNVSTFAEFKSRLRSFQRQHGVDQFKCQDIVEERASGPSSLMRMSDLNQAISAAETIAGRIANDAHRRGEQRASTQTLDELHRYVDEHVLAVRPNHTEVTVRQLIQVCMTNLIDAELAKRSKV